MTEASAYHGLGWNPVDDLQQLLAYPFMVHALLAGTVVAVLAGVTGWLVVLRRQVFAGHTLALIAFPGAAAATLAGVPVAVGAFGFCAAGAFALGGLSGARRSHSSESAAIGTLQAVALAAGLVFASLAHTLLGGLNALLFGTVLGISARQVAALALVAVVFLAVLAAAGRPLVFASVDGDVAAARGLPVRALGAVFLLVLGLSVAATAQITGTLLVFALLVTPAATAHLLTSRPFLGVTLSVAIAIAVTWVGLALAFFSDYPAGFFVTSVAFAGYVAARAWDAFR